MHTALPFQGATWFSSVHIAVLSPALYVFFYVTVHYMWTLNIYLFYNYHSFIFSKEKNSQHKQANKTQNKPIKTNVKPQPSDTCLVVFSVLLLLLFKRDLQSQ